MGKFKRKVKELKELIDVIPKLDEMALDKLDKCIQAQKVRDLIKKKSDNDFTLKEPSVEYKINSKGVQNG